MAAASEPRFRRDPDLPALYWAEGADLRAVFVCPDPDLLGDNPSLAETWAVSLGSYVFVRPVSRTSDVAVREAIRHWSADHADGTLPRFGWLSLATGLDSMAATQTSDGTWVLAGHTADLAGYQIGVRAGVAVAPMEHPIGGWGFGLAPDPAGPVALALFTPRSLIPAEDGSVLLDLTGRWHFTVTGGPDPEVDDQEPDVFEQLCAGLRYFFARDVEHVEAVHFPVLRAEGPHSLYATVDPADALDHKRSFLGFFPDPELAEGRGAAISTTYVDHIGHPLTLTPVVGPGLLPPRLVFERSPTSLTDSGSDGRYLAFSGSFAVGAAHGATNNHALLCGVKGVEILKIPDRIGCLTFVAGHHALVGPIDRTTTAPKLGKGALTSWVRVDATEPPRLDDPWTIASYGSTPSAGSPFRRNPDPSRADDILLVPVEPDTEELTTGPVTDTARPFRPVFPLAPFAGLAPADVPLAKELERMALAPSRRTKLYNATKKPGSPPVVHVGGAADSLQLGVTTQGLTVAQRQVTDPAPGWEWVWVGIGHTGDPAPEPSLRFTTISDGLKAALQTANLFLVMGAGGAYADHCGYRLSEANLDRVHLSVAPRIVRPSIRDRIRDAVHDGRLSGWYTHPGALEEGLRGLVPELTDDELAAYAAATVDMTATVDGWHFQLFPGSGAEDSFLIIKLLADRSVAELVADLSAWTWPEASGANPTAVQSKIRSVLQQAAAHPAGSPYDHFNQVVNDKTWTGVLSLGSDIPFEGLPAAVQPLAAGIVRSAFRAHHFGLTLTSFTLTTPPVFQPSSTFALVDYHNPEDQYTLDNISFAFRVRRLVLQIQNSAVTAFSSNAQLLVNRLFGSPTRLMPTGTGNNLQLDGVVRIVAGSPPSYTFAFAGNQTYQLDGGALHDVEVLGAQLVVAHVPTAASIRHARLSPDGDEAAASIVRAAFVLSGNLRFAELPDVDLFSWGPTAAGADGYLRFGNLAVTMDFPITDPLTVTFGLDTSALTFDVATSSAPRANSFANRFPARLSGMLASADPGYATPGPGSPLPGVFVGAAVAPLTPVSVPDDLGYTSISIPMQQQKLTQPWYGLDYVIDLGTLGAQAGSSPIAVHLLFAWSPVDIGAPPVVYAGALLPGAGSKLAASLPLQGFLKLGFNSIELLVDNTTTAGTPPTLVRSYTLRLRDFGLKLLGLSLPPGQNDVILFANPDQSGDTKVGWYVAYAAAGNPTQQAAPVTRQQVQRLQSARRAQRKGS